MNIASLKEIKKEVSEMPPAELVDFCLSIIKSRKENKEFAHYLLFEKSNEDGYAEKIRAFLEEEFTNINASRTFFIKKGFRRILRLANKYLRYSKQDETAIKIYLFLIEKFDSYAHENRCYYETRNIVGGVLAKTHKLINSLHEDLQYDYRRKLEAIK